MKLLTNIAVMAVFLIFSNLTMAADSYRYLHVSIDTPWMIFIFLLIIILFPFVLMAILYWYFAFKKPDEDKPTVADADSQ